MTARPSGEALAGETFRLAGIEDAVEILIDRWGIPHIFASTTHDAWFAQGFNAARDRLWQLDLWRRAGLGRLAGILGPQYVERDRAARLFLYRGSMEEERHAYGSGLDEILDPFVDGINAYVHEARSRSEALPPEFEALEYEPDYWSSDDILRIRSHGRYRNLRSEVARAQVLHRYGPGVESLRAWVEPETHLTVPDGLDLSRIEPGALHTYDLATGPPLGLGGGSHAAASDGSNNWVVAGDRTETGRPILANDPHRVLPLPSLRYLVHVSSPELSFAGGGEPMLPGISFGHNGRTAYGITVLPVDQEDLYVYELDEIGGGRYRYDGGWEEIKEERESIEVRGADDVEVDLRFTRHGPLIHESEEDGAALAVRAAWLSPGMAPYLGGVSLVQAGDWQAFRRAARHWGGPGENLVYADIEGNIGWQPAGRIPVRPNWNGLLPVPGDGRYEWSGFADPDTLPHELNPARGWIATANQSNAAATTDEGVDSAFEWEPPFRYLRIAEVLDQSALSTPKDAAALQNDYMCLAAREAIPHLRELALVDPKAVEAREMLQSWDLRLESSSAVAALFEVWFRKHLRRALFTRALTGKLDANEVEGAVAAVMYDESVVRDPRIDLKLLDRLMSDLESASSVIELSLSEAMRDLEGLLGSVSDQWSWGALHRAVFEHPLGDRDPRLESIGPLPRGGSCDTVGSTDYGTSGFIEAVGASARVVLDIGEWDGSLAINSPGQAGDPKDSHYADLAGPWAQDSTVPLPFSREAVEEAVERRIFLEGDSNRT